MRVTVSCTCFWFSCTIKDEWENCNIPSLIEETSLERKYKTNRISWRKYIVFMNLQILEAPVHKKRTSTFTLGYAVGRSAPPPGHSDRDGSIQTIMMIKSVLHLLILTLLNYFCHRDTEHRDDRRRFEELRVVRKFWSIYLLTSCPAKQHCRIIGPRIRWSFS